MIIKDLQTGREHKYGTNPHDSLVVSEDGRTLTYYNLQNGDGSRVGEYRFVPEIEAPDASYWNIGGMGTQPRWIPCDEALPAEHKEVLIITRTGPYIAELEIFNGHQYWSEVVEYRNITGVLAWQPLPEYQKEDQK